MLKQTLLRQIEETREALNNVVGNYEVGEDSDEIIELSHCLDEFIIEYMELTK